MIYKIEYEKVKEYQRFILYKVFKVINETNKRIFLYNTTKLKKDGYIYEKEMQSM